MTHFIFDPPPGQERLIQQIADLEKEVQALRAHVAHLEYNQQRCTAFPGGERCALPRGHEGGCKWARGD